MRRDFAEGDRSGPSGLSPDMAVVAAHQLERDDLDELIAVAEAEHGRITEEEIGARRDQLQSAREDQHYANRGAM